MSVAGTAEGRILPRSGSTDRPSDRAFLGASALLFAASAVATILWCESMSAMQGMPMPGGWMMSMTWMRGPGQTWPGAAASFLGMWTVMMVAMMLPALIPMLNRYRRAVARAGDPPLGRLTTVVAAGYFLVWAALGLAVFPLGVVFAHFAMRLPALAGAVPFAAGALVVAAGALQFTRWKAQRLACCRQPWELGPSLPADVRTAWREGLRLGRQCSRCCGNLMVVLLVVGAMDLRAMALVTAAITAERVAPSGERSARAVGAVLLVVGLLLIVRALLAG